VEAVQADCSTALAWRWQNRGHRVGCIIWSLRHVCSIVSRPQTMAVDGGNQHKFVSSVHRSGASKQTVDKGWYLEIHSSVD